jgi:very-short-patch-repair endonuclease
MASENARRLRRGMTDAERKLWSLLRRKQLQGFRFRRQVPLGPYVADFVCMSAPGD